MLLPIGLWHGVARGEGMTTELALLAAGAASFLVGTSILRSRRGE